MKLHHIAIQVHDLEKARAFYVDVLGLPELRRQPHSIWVGADDGVIVMLETGPDPARGGLQALAFAMAPDARETWREKLVAAGHAIEGETDFTIYTRDADGTRVALSSYPTKSR